MNPELLGNLRDIHEPLPPPFWPPAPGWWILAILLLAAIAFTVFVFRHRHRARERARAPYRIALTVLDDAYQAFESGETDARAFADASNAIMKRLIAQHEGRASVTTFGADWITELVDRFERPDLHDVLERTLGTNRFRPAFEADIDETFARLRELIQMIESRAGA